MARANIEELVEAIVSSSGREVVVIIIGGELETKSESTPPALDEYPHESDQSDIDYEKDFFLQAFLEAIFGKKKTVAGSGGSSSSSSLDAILQGPFTP